MELSTVRGTVFHNDLGGTKRDKTGGEPSDNDTRRLDEHDDLFSNVEIQDGG
jgi:hypothetical protein